MNLTVDRSLLTRKLVDYGDIASKSKERNSAASEPQTKSRPLSPPATTRPPTEKGANSDRKRLRSPDIRNDDDGTESTRKKPKLKRIDKDGKPVRRDDDGVTSTSNARPAKKGGHRSKREKPDKKEPDVDMDFFSGPSKTTSATKRKDVAPAATTHLDGGVANLSKKQANGPSGTALGKPRNGTDSNKPPTAAAPKPTSRAPAGDGLFIKKRKVSPSRLWQSDA